MYRRPEHRSCIVTSSCSVRGCGSRRKREKTLSWGSQTEVGPSLATTAMLYSRYYSVEVIIGIYPSNNFVRSNSQLESPHCFLGAEITVARKGRDNYCFVEFASTEDAKNFMAKYNHQPLREYRIQQDDAEVPSCLQ